MDESVEKGGDMLSVVCALLICAAVPGCALDLFPAAQSGAYGYIDHTGTFKIPPRFAYAFPFYDGLARVERGGKWYYIESQGQQISKVGFDIDHSSIDVGESSTSIFDFQEGRAIVSLHGKYGAIDQSGKLVIPTKYDRLYSFREGLAPFVVESTLSQGFVDRNGREVIPPVYGTISWLAPVQGFSEGLAPFTRHGKYGFIDKQGKIVIQPSFDDARWFSEGLAPVARGSKWGLVDPSGAVRLQFVYDYVSVSRNGTLAAKLGNQWFLIDRSGKKLLSESYDTLVPEDEFIIYMKNRKFGLIDYSLKVITPPVYTIFGGFAFGFAVVKDAKGYGVVDKTGRLVVPTEYLGIQILAPNMFAAGSRTFHGYLDGSGNRVYPRS